MRECKSTFNILKDKPTGKKPIGRSRRRWETMDFKETRVSATVRTRTNAVQDTLRALVISALNSGFIPEVIVLIRDIRQMLAL